jgi:TatD DNase family protein
MLVDSHCHLQDRKFATDLDEVIARAREANVKTMVTIGYDMPSSRRGIEIAGSYDRVYATIGVHPHDAKTLTEGDIQELEQMSKHPKVVGIGEIGLDFYRNLSPREDQERAFREQLELARTLSLPVVIHSRDADEEVFAILAEHAHQAHQTIPEWQPLGVMHTFAGDLDLARRYIDIGFAISISGTVTYPAAEKTREVAKTIPLSSMTLETDSPYLPPQSIRGQRNEPAQVRDVAEYVAELRGDSYDELCSETAHATAKLFNLIA